MNYKGIIIEESLKDPSILRGTKILEQKVEQVTEQHQTPWLSQWTLDTVEIPEEKAGEIAKAISQGLEIEHTAWYADFKNEKYHYIIFANKIFKVNLSNPSLYNDAKEYGASLGIPSYQLDFAPEDTVWKR